MTKKGFERLGKQLLPDLPGFVAKGQLVFSRPLGDMLRGLCFDGSSFDASIFFVHVFVQPLYVPAVHVDLTLGWRIAGDSGQQWKITAQDVVPELREAIKREALPFLDRTKSPRDLAQSLEMLLPGANPYVKQAIAYSLGRVGAIREAAQALDELVRLLAVPEQYAWQRRIAERAEVLKMKLVADPSIAQLQLDDWARQTKRNLGLEGFS